MTSDRHSWIVRYALAVVFVAAGMLLRVVLTAWVGTGLPTYITFYPCVMTAALLAGTGPGLTATILLALVTDYWLLPPAGFGIVDFKDAVGLSLFTIMGVAISVVTGRYRRIRNRLTELVAERTKELDNTNAALQQLNAELEQRVVTKTAEIRQANEMLEQRIAERTSEIRTANVELARSNKDLEQFAHVASHDLKEPLRMVTGFMSLLKERYGGKLDDKAREYIGFATDAADRMQKMVDDLLAYSRAGRGNVAELADTAAVMDSALKNLQAGIEESGAVITCDPLPTVSGSSVGLTHVFQNLVGNAIKFRKPGTRPEIHIGARRMTEEECGSMGVRAYGSEGQEPAYLHSHTPKPPYVPFWQFSIRDNGIGIDPQFADRIFMIFQRLHTREEYPGSGVGLAICKKIVELHGGTIWVESKPEKGSIFYFTMPDIKKE